MTAAIKINQNDGKTRNVMTGGETEIDFDFPIFAATHLAVYETDTAGDITLLVKDTDYTVPAGSVGVQAGGTIDLDGTQYPSGATAGHVFTVYQNAPESRTTDFNQAGDFFADTLNKELDLITQQIQQLRRDLARAPLAPVDTTLTTLTMPDPQDGYGFVWNGTAGAIRNTTASLENIETYGATITASIANINAVGAGLLGSDNIGAVAAIAADVTQAATDSLDIQQVSSDSADIQLLADIQDGTTATDAITDVAASISSVVIAAANISTIVQAAEAVASALAFTFDSSTTMADPGTGDVRFNNAAFASVTAVAIDALTAQTGNPDLSDFIATWDDSTSASKGFLRFSKGGAPENFAIFEITALTDNTGWLQITVTHVDSAGSFSNADTLYLTFTRTGDQGLLNEIVQDTTPQLGGDLDANGKNITDIHELRIDATPDTDQTANGHTTSTINAGATISALNLCYLASDGEFALADADAEATAGGVMLAIALEAGTDGNPMKVALPGSFVRDDTWNWTVGQELYVSTTPGAITGTPPSVSADIVRVIGYAVTADIIYFLPESGWVEVR